jgi:hypothetical protein
MAKQKEKKAVFLICLPSHANCVLLSSPWGSATGEPGGKRVSNFSLDNLRARL